MIARANDVPRATPPNTQSAPRANTNNALVHDRFAVDRRAMTDRFASHTDVARAGRRGVSTRVTSSNQNAHTRLMS